ncbi:MAG: beta-lactamase family protein, partial [Marinilabiliaceae bacterium]|nr:beta-lactamase family protein [Marinilabiliaceae bacterium]
PNSPQTVFRIASTSKQFTAACIILLSQQGKLSLDDKLINYFPDFPSYANTITIRQLLNHTSGIREYLTLAQLSGLTDDDHYTDQTVRKWLAKQNKLNFKPGDEHSYSNSGYWLLGQIVNQVSGISMAEYAEKYIFKSLEMNHTHFHNDHTRIVKNRASGYAPNESNGYAISMTTLEMVGDGGLFTTVEDLKKWDDSFYDSTVLNPNFWKQMTTVGTLNNGEELTYAAGLGVVNYKGLKLIHHGGAFVGFRAEMIRFPEHHFSVIILANRADADPTQMALQIADMFLEQAYHNPQSDVTAEAQVHSDNESRAIVSLPNNKLQAFEGVYWNHQARISRQLEIRNDTLYYVRTNGRVTKMVPIAANAFLWTGTKIPIVLQFEEAASPKTFTLQIPGKAPSHYSAYTPINSFSQADLKDYSGEYYSAELDITYSLQPENNGIMLHVNGEATAPLIPIMEKLMTLDAGQIFEFNDTKEEFNVSMDGVTDLKFSKINRLPTPN